MSGIVQGIGDLFASVFHIIQGVFQAIGTTIATAFSAVTGLISSLFDMFEGLVGFILGKQSRSCKKTTS